MSEWHRPLLIAIGLIFLSLAVGSVIRVIALRALHSEFTVSRTQSLVVWWVLAILLAGSLLAGEIGAGVLIGGAATLGFREFCVLLYPRVEISWWSASSIIVWGWISLGLIVFGREALAMYLFPIATLVTLSILQMSSQHVTSHIMAIAVFYLGGMLTFYTLFHALLLFQNSALWETPVGPAGLFLYLVLLTESNDIAQALVGRLLGRRGIAPVISPRKTREGLYGGLIVTGLLGILLAPWLTHFVPVEQTRSGSGWAVAGLAGLIISLSGFLGDLNMSAIKREARVKDSSHLLPGMGGMLDRIDSLTFSAPAFFYFVLCTNFLWVDSK